MSTLTTLSVCSLTIRPPDVPGTEQPDAEPQAGEPGVQRGGHETHDRVRSQEEQVLDANGHPGHRGLRNGLLLVQEAASAALAADPGAGSGRPAEGVGQRNRSSNVPVIRYPDGPAVHGLINGAGLLFGPVRDLIASVGPWPGWPGGREPTRHFFIPEGVGHRQTFLPHAAALATRATWRATSSLPDPLEWVWVLRGRAWQTGRVSCGGGICTLKAYHVGGCPGATKNSLGPSFNQEVPNSVRAACAAGRPDGVTMMLLTREREEEDS